MTEIKNRKSNNSKLAVTNKLLEVLEDTEVILPVFNTNVNNEVGLENRGSTKLQEAIEVDRKNRIDEMARRFNKDLKELNCQWVYEELWRNSQFFQGQLSFASNK